MIRRAFCLAALGLLFPVMPAAAQIARIAAVVTHDPTPPGSERIPGLDPPASVVAVDPSSMFFLEIWATNSAPPLDGLACVYVDVIFDRTDLIEATAVSDSPLMPLNLVPTVIDNAVGLIDDAGGCQSIPPIDGLGVDEWFLVDSIAMTAGATRGAVTVTVGDADNLFAGTAVTGQPVNLDPRDIEFIGAFFTVGRGLPCTTISDCADVDGDGIRDDNCLWWACTRGQCMATEIVFADVGGQFGACVPDGTADGNDRFTVLNCFANVDPNLPPPAPFPCEEAAPAAFNVDPGGRFGSCLPDGICDGNDAFATLNAFGNTSTCTCPLDGPAPSLPRRPLQVTEAHLELRSSAARVMPGGYVDVTASLDALPTGLRGYQLHIEATGGRSGALHLVDIFVDTRTAAHAPHVFAGRDYWDAYNVATGQMVAGLDAGQVTTTATTYLATFRFRAAADARGTFVIDIRDDVDDSTDRTFLFGADADVAIVPSHSAPLRLIVQPRHQALSEDSASYDRL